MDKREEPPTQGDRTSPAVPDPRRALHVDDMDHIVEEALDKGLLHGETGRTILGAYEGHKELQWMQHAGTAMIVGVIVALPGFIFGWPQLLIIVPFGICALVAIVCLGIGFVHLLRYYGILLRPAPPGQANTAAPPLDPAGEDHGNDG